MFEIRQILVRIRLGDTDRQVRRAGLCGRKKAAEIRAVAAKRGWLSLETQHLVIRQQLGLEN
jgi:hypothetical protein